MQTKTTDGITIRIKSYYEEGSSRPLNQYFAFSYVVEIENNSSFDVQLLRRYWIIKDANKDVKEVEGPGVIGQQPIIKPEEYHRYSSWVPLSTPIGKMAGYYTMKRMLDGSTFRAYIPEFLLCADFIKN
ncbi:MAG: Co2+/Mg2+ efflux protein ApaG [Saprospiraceae bacterium]|nr:Co2+/Mg2+ efflux protein ApaG [Bacteroidia bacterium]MBT8230338.1 Co2+/Mg2+ efflux protein ApaG [Bacteroidia bacterium]NNF21702.1 Co2+/Mg2+ efflux protein ApaG [Saprospiraceae bacterium]NNK89263.1 Co2+/Mg2+ efflux protein ApaG [Saprospiraceae bacterium]